MRCKQLTKRLDWQFRVNFADLSANNLFMSEHTNILIIGGGISGLLTARALRLAGLSVRIIDHSELGRESSWAGGGILLPIYPWRQSPAISRLVIPSLSSYPELNQELFTATGIDPEWTPCGMLIGKNPDFSAAQTWCHEHGIACQTPPDEMLTPFDCQFDNPLWLPSIAQARNPRLLQSLATFLRERDVAISEHARIESITVQNRNIRHLRIDGQTIACDQVVLCTGAWTNQFLQHWLPETSLRLEIKPVRGQMILFDARPETLTHMVLDGDQYLIPRRDGKILAGSTVEEAGFEKVTTQAAGDQLYRFATQLFPELKKFSVCHHWAGLRPGTPNGVPYIGMHPEIDNLAINAGHFRNGLVMGPASAQLAADILLNKAPAIDPTPYAVNR